MDAETHSPTSTLAILVGVLAGVVVCFVAAVMLRIYAWRRRMSTASNASSATDASSGGEMARSSSTALIATTLSVLEEPIPELVEDEAHSADSPSTISTVTTTRWQQVRGFIARICRSSVSIWISFRLQLTRRSSTPPKSSLGARCSQADADVATPTNGRHDAPVTPTSSQHSSKFQLRLFRSPSTITPEVGMI